MTLRRTSVVARMPWNSCGALLIAAGLSAVAAGCGASGTAATPALPAAAASALPEDQGSTAVGRPGIRQRGPVEEFDDLKERRARRRAEAGN